MLKAEYINEIKEKLSVGFNAVEASSGIIDALDSLCQIMFDPENQPPQISTDEAWKIFQSISKGLPKC